MIFRAATLSDHPSIVDFQLAMALETEKLKLDLGTCTKGVRAVFEQDHGNYHVCELKGEIVGSLLITYEWSDWRNGKVWWIHSVYLKPEARGKGIFSGFYSYIKNLAQADPNIRGLRLYVDNSNSHAQKVYAKIGMNGDHYRLFEWMKTF